MTGALLVLTACPDLDCAGRIAEQLVARRLAACVSQLAPMASVYRWNGAVERAQEIPLLVKCSADRYPAVEAAIRELHPYEVPEIVALPLAAGYGPYLRWIDAETRPTRLA